MSKPVSADSSFPVDFAWGVAAAAFQIEGAANADGKGLSVWDMMCRQSGRVYEGHTGDVACDHYHRYREDVAIMRGIGVKAYRLSVSWPRVIPGGTGAVNEAGLAFYDRLVDELLTAGIQPWVTLFHWDFPYELYCRGGWLNRDSAEWFADYTRVVVDRLSDRVGHWMTLNEPQCFAGLGHYHGVQAPGDRLGLAEVLRIGHHALLAHGRSVQVIRTQAKTTPVIGWAPVGTPVLPEDPSKPADVAAARQAMFAMGPHDPAKPRGEDGFFWANSWWSDPVVLGHYPEDGWASFGSAVPELRADDLATISQPLDFYGVNIYRGLMARAGADGMPESVRPGPGFPRTALKWPVTPEALYWGPKFFQERYKLPVVITENGLSGADWVALDGHVHDAHRIDFLKRYLRALRRAMADGVDVRGYFHWSILDNFEWADGYKERFGLIHVDYATLKRTPKDSALWYREVIASNGKNLALD